MASIFFCVDDTHAAFMAQELRRIAGEKDYAARITRSERNSRQLEKNFAEVGRSKPRIAVTVDLLSTGYDALDVKNIVFARPIKSSILYKQMKGRGTRLYEDIDKRYFTIFDELLKIWIDKSTRNDLRAELKDQDVYIATF